MPLINLIEDPSKLYRSLQRESKRKREFGPLETLQDLLSNPGIMDFLLNQLDPWSRSKKLSLLHKDLT